MGEGGLHIMEHKSWNVYGGANIEKERRDEEAASEMKKSRRTAVGSALFCNATRRIAF
ncbi:hypothetical protein BC829DRAFT_404247 [Chytridium lagenaria]|nr:hypothetical protein BC829DRAFT_404247 [Chytridium lagenaria]